MVKLKSRLPRSYLITGCIVVMLIVFFGIPKWLGSWNQFEMDREVSSLVDDLIMARNIAIKNRHKVYVIFDPQKGSYKIHEDVNDNRKRDAEEPFREVQLDGQVQFGVTSGESITNIWGTRSIQENPIDFLEGGKQVEFNSKGQANINGAVYMAPSNGVNPEKGKIWAVRILRASGAIQKLRYNPEKTPPWS